MLWFLQIWWHTFTPVVEDEPQIYEEQHWRKSRKSYKEQLYVVFPYVAFEIELSSPQDGRAFEVGETLYVNRIVRLVEYTSVFNYYKP